MAINLLGKNLSQMLSALGATNVTRTAAVDDGGVKFDNLRADLPNGGNVTGKIVDPSSGEMSALWVDEADGSSDTALIGFQGVTRFQDHFEPAKNGAPLTLTSEFDKQGDGEPDSRRTWVVGSPTVKLEWDSDGDGHIDSSAIEPEE
jgi:hypothetical protein